MSKLISFLLSLSLITFFLLPRSANAADVSRKITLIAGKKSHGPGEHEYVKSVKLLKILLDQSPNLHGIATEIYFNGWPDDPTVLDTADTIVLISDGMEWLPWTFAEDRVRILQKQFDRGCGFLTLHFSTYVPVQFARQALHWNGGFFDYDGDPAIRSAQKTIETVIALPTKDHPIVRGVAPYHYKEEFYYKMHFVPEAAQIIPIVTVPALSDKPQEQIVGWAFRSKNGGRSVGFTFGHYYENWKLDDYRKLILNAIVWTSGAEVPVGGVQSTFVGETEVNKIPDNVRN